MINYKSFGDFTKYPEPVYNRYFKGKQKKINITISMFYKYSHFPLFA